MSVGPGQAPMTQGQQKTFDSMLSQTGLPKNPNTEAIRTDPQNMWLAKLRGIEGSFDEAINEPGVLDGQDKETQVLLASMKRGTYRLRQGNPGKETSLRLAADVLESIAPQIAQQCSALLQQLQQPVMQGQPQMGGMPPQIAMQMGGGMPPTGGPPGAMPAGPAPPPSFGGG